MAFGPNPASVPVSAQPMSEEHFLHFYMIRKIEATRLCGRLKPYEILMSVFLSNAS